MNTRVRKITLIAMFSAIAFVIVALIRIPVISFLSYEPKDVIITVGGFLIGPLASFVISVITSFIEMVTISDTGIIGCIMNIISTCAFASTAAFIYKKKHTLSGAILGLLSGCFVMTAAMLLWNYIVTPFYMGLLRTDVARMLIPVFLPFNIIKAGLNMGITLLIYKPIVITLRKSGFIDPSSKASRKSNTIGTFITAVLLLTTLILLLLVIRGII